MIAGQHGVADHRDDQRPVGSQPGFDGAVAFDVDGDGCLEAIAVAETRPVTVLDAAPGSE